MSDSDKKWPEFIDSPLELQERLLLDPPEDQEVVAEDWRAVQGKAPAMPPLPRLTPQKLREFVAAVLANQVFLSTQVREPKLIPHIFLPLALGGFQGWKDEDLANIGVIYEYYGRQQAPSSINGYPIFFSCHILHKDDWALADAALRKALKAQGEALATLEDCETETG